MPSDSTRCWPRCSALGRGDLFFGFEATSLGGQIERHFYNNDDWTVEQLFDELGAIDNASDRRFALFLEGIVSGNTVPDEDGQRQLVEAINPPLTAVGLELRETGNIDGYPPSIWCPPAHAADARSN